MPDPVKLERLSRADSIELAKAVLAEYKVLPDFAESFYGTNPRLADSDGDGYPDGEEVRFGYHPLGFGKMESLTPPSP